jgi:uncharacterized membrane protein YphA (DoxX/SURF4 family)
MKYSVGRYVYGLAVIGFGICALVFHDISNWVQLKALVEAPYYGILVYVVAAVLLLGGIAVQIPGTARAGAVALGALFFAFALLAIPAIIAQPLVYNGYGNFLEIFSFVSGAAILFAWSGPVAPDRASRFAQFGYYSFGICVLSFGLEQLFYLAPTASLVPKWIPPGQIFWAIATTVAFGLAAIALLTGFKARLASLLTKVMLVVFGVVVWLPALFTDPHSFVNWTESLETLGIVGSAWIIADYLGQRRSSEATAT